MSEFGSNLETERARWAEIEADDDIELPSRLDRGRKRKESRDEDLAEKLDEPEVQREESEERLEADAARHGGDGATAGGGNAAGGPGGSVAGAGAGNPSQGPEPAPEHEELVDDEPVEEDAAEEPQAPVEAEEVFDEEGDSAEDADAEESDAEADADADADQHGAFPRMKSRNHQKKKKSGDGPLETHDAKGNPIYQRNVAFTHNGKSGDTAADKKAGLTDVQFRNFPAVLAKHLRSELATAAGEAFAKQISSQAMLVAYILATLGVELEVDVNTERAVQAFRAMDSRTAILEDGNAEILSDIGRMASAIKGMHQVIGDLNQRTGHVELAQAYMLTDRVAPMSTEGVTVANIDLLQPKVLTARDTVRRRYYEQSKVETIQKGRPMS